MGAMSDHLVRRRAKRALLRRLDTIQPHPDQDSAERRRATLESVRAQPAVPGTTSPLARADLPLEFWERILGPRMSAASAIWPRWAKDVDHAEVEWLQVVAERAELAPGQRVLEIGASLGAVARWAEEDIPGLHLTLAVADPALFPVLERVHTAHGPESAILTPDLENYAPMTPFDRILVLEALGGLANPIPLLHRLASWLAPGGRLLFQTTCHWRSSYFFESGSENRWLFDTPDGALMPGEELFAALATELPILDRWELSGEHVERTVKAWRRNLDEGRSESLEILSRHGGRLPKRSFSTWRNALLSQEIMFGFREGQEWALTQFLLGENHR